MRFFINRPNKRKYHGAVNREPSIDMCMVLAR